MKLTFGKFGQGQYSNMICTPQLVKGHESAHEDLVNRLLYSKQYDKLTKSRDLISQLCPNMQLTNGCFYLSKKAVKIYKPLIDSVIDKWKLIKYYK